jgi:hypothetical protein
MKTYWLVRRKMSVLGEENCALQKTFPVLKTGLILFPQGVQHIISIGSAISYQRCWKQNCVYPQHVLFSWWFPPGTLLLLYDLHYVASASCWMRWWRRDLTAMECAQVPWNGPAPLLLWGILELILADTEWLCFTSFLREGAQMKSRLSRPFNKGLVVFTWVSRSFVHWRCLAIMTSMCLPVTCSVCDSSERRASLWVL